MVDPSPLVEVRRSARRRRTVSAYRDGDKIVVLMPARTSKAEERRLIDEMVDRITRREASYATKGARGSDQALMARARELSEGYLDGRAQPAGVRWVRNMNSRWGSCTTTDRTIRLSHRLQSMPSWVIDYVLVHELSHLLEPGHGPRFWAWAGRYPRTERARGYLEGIAMAAHLPELSSGESCAEPGFGSESEWDPVDSGDPVDGAPVDSGDAVAAGGSGMLPPLAASRPSSVKSASSGTDSSGLFP